MKNKFKNLIALVVMAMCFSTFTLAETKTILPANAEQISLIQTENTPTVTWAQTGTNLKDTVGVNADLQNKVSVADVATNDTNDSVLTLNYFDGGTSIEVSEPIGIQRLTTEPDNLYLSSTRATNFRPPNNSFGLSIYERPKRPLKFFNAVNIRINRK